jgi:hypothetical protein
MSSHAGSSVRGAPRANAGPVGGRGAGARDASCKSVGKVVLTTTATCSLRASPIQRNIIGSLGYFVPWAFSLCASFILNLSRI